MLRFLKVSESSLYPAYQDGDFVLISKIPILFGRLRPGDAVVFRHAIYGTMIKLVQQIGPGPGEIFVIGLSEESVDSRRFGPIPIHDLQGKVIWHIRRPTR
jgi:hypothetical protein